MEDTEVPKITSQEKTKDPRKVEAGRRLGLMSKAAKEKKMRERIFAEQNLNKDVLKQNKNNTAFLLVLGTLVVMMMLTNVFKMSQMLQKVVIH